jgi:hypothetical protein
MELLEPLYRRDEQTATTFGFRLPAFHRQRTLKPTIYGHAASTPFAFGPFRWMLELHLNGNGAWEGRSVSAFLACVSKLCQGMCVRVPISMTVLRTDGGDPGLHVVKGSESPRDVHEFSGASRRVGWPDLVPLHDIASFLDSAEGLIVHVAMAKPARCCFEQPLSRDVIGGIDVFYSRSLCWQANCGTSVLIRATKMTWTCSRLYISSWAATRAKPQSTPQRTRTVVLSVLGLLLPT